jgi:putative ABC transport system permease protein
MRVGVVPMLAVTLADLRYRYRQFLIAVVGAGVVLAMAILLAGVAAGFGVEINRTVGGEHADRWVVSDKSQGRLTAVASFPAASAAAVAAQAGVGATAGFVLVPQEAVRVGDTNTTGSIVGVVPHHLGSPVVSSGRPLDDRGGEAVVDPAIGAHVGDDITIGARRFRVVGTVADRTLLGGMANIYISLPDAQAVAFGGQSLVTAILTTGVPRRAPAGLMVLTNSQVEHQTLETLGGATGSIANLRDLMWVIAAIIVAALVYVSALQRVRDFAVFKALGSSSGVLFASLCLQSVLVTLIAAGFGAAVSTPLKGVFQQPVAVPASAFVTLPIVAVVVGLLSSLVALRTATRADPVAAFGG